MIIFDMVFSFFIPVVFIIIGIVFLLMPPKNINFIAGWRTERAMKNKETWYFANTYGGKGFVLIGLIELIITASCMALLWRCNQEIKDLMTVVYEVAQCFMMIPLYRKVEDELEKKFY